MDAFQTVRPKFKIYMLLVMGDTKIFNLYDTEYS